MNKNMRFIVAFILLGGTLPVVAMDLSNVRVKREDITEQEDSTTQHEDESTVVQRSAKKSRIIKSPLCQAIKDKEDSSIDSLLKQRGAVGVKDSKGILPLFYAIENRAPYVEKIIAQMEAEKLMTDECKGKALLLACAKGHGGLISLLGTKYPELLSDSVNVESKFLNNFHWNSIPQKDSIFLAPLECALLSGKKEAVDALIKTSDSLKIPDDSPYWMKITEKSFNYALDLHYFEPLIAVLKARRMRLTEKNAVAAYEKGCADIIAFCIEDSARWVPPMSLNSLIFIAASKNDTVNVEKLKSKVLGDGKIFDSLVFAGALSGKHFELAKHILNRKIISIDDSVGFIKDGPLVWSAPYAIKPLTYAIENGDKELFEFLMKNNATWKNQLAVDIGRYNPFSHLYPFTIAVLNGKFDIADILLEKGADINANNMTNALCRALDIATAFKKSAAVNYLISKKANPTQVRLGPGGMIQWQEIPNQEPAVPLAAVPKVNPKQTTQNAVSDYPVDLTSFPLACVAIRSGDVEKLKKLMETELKTARSNTAHINNLLTFALISNQVAVITFLLENTGCSFKPTLDSFIKDKRHDYFATFIEAAKKVGRGAIDLLVECARRTIYHGATDFLEPLLKEPMLKQSGFIDFAMFEAAEQGQKEIVELLLQYMPDLYRSKKLGEPYKMASEFAKTPEIKKLLEQALSEQSDAIQSALQALYEGKELNKDVLPLINNRDKNGKNLLIYCLEKKNLQAVKQLIANNVDVSRVDTSGVPPLVYAVGIGIKECVELLCTANTHKKLGSDYGKALEVAIVKGSLEMAHYLFDMWKPVQGWSEQAAYFFKMLQGALTKEKVLFLLSKEAFLDGLLFKDAYLHHLSHCRFQLAPLLVRSHHIIDPVKPIGMDWGAMTLVADTRAGLAKKALSAVLPDGRAKEHVNLDLGESVLFLNLLQHTGLKEYLKDPQKYVEIYKDELVRFYADPADRKNATDDSFSKGACHDKQVTLLMYACIFGHRAVVEKLVSLPQEYCNRQDKHGRTALMYALLYGNVDCALTLIHHHDLQNPQGAQGGFSNHCGNGIHLKDLNNRTALFYAAYAARCDHASEMEEQGKKVALSKLAYSQCSGALKVLEVLQKLGAKGLSPAEIDLAIKIAVEDENDEHATAIRASLNALKENF